MPETKDRWDKAKIIAAILLPIAIAYLGYRYHDDRQDQARLEFQWDLLVGITNGNHTERELFVEFAQIVARHTEDTLFIRITDSWSERLLQRLRAANLGEGDPDRLAGDLQAYYSGALRQDLEEGDAYYAVRLFGRAARSYLRAASNLPQGLDYDLELWRDAVELTHSDPKAASEKFRRFFRDHRDPAMMFR